MVLVFTNHLKYRSIKTIICIFGLQSSDDSPAGLVTSSLERELQITVEFTRHCFTRSMSRLHAIPKHPRPTSGPARSSPWGCYTAQSGGNRAFYRWLTRDYRPLFPQLPERTPLSSPHTHQDWRGFLPAPTVLGSSTPYGIELIHPMREGAAPSRWPQRRVNHR